MLTKLRIRNFKQFEDVEIELGQSVVFIGPNNSGKTTALQALALWSIGFARKQDWQHELLVTGSVAGTADISDREISINRLDLAPIPVPNTDLLWRNRRIKNGESNHLEVTVDWTNFFGNWSERLRFRYANDESIYLDVENIDTPGSEAIPRMVFLPSMSGLVSTEPQIQPGRINVLIGEGRTAEVLRNLCLQLYESFGRWDKVVSHIKQQFGIELLPPQYLPTRGEIRMSYKDRSGVTLDLASSGRGMLQILLLLAYMYNNPGAVLLLDEPDAHLEILRQRQIYQLLTQVAEEQGSQIIVATHSEVVLEEAANRDDTIIAFLGKPHQITKTSEVLKSLKDIPFDEYYLAEEKGWVLYLEGTTDLDILRAFVERLNHAARESLKLPFVYYMESNYPSDAEKHFNGLREAKSDLIGVALFDQISAKKLQGSRALKKLAWQRKEIENYLALPDALMGYARQNNGEKGAQAMDEIIHLFVPPIALNDPNDVYWLNTKTSDDLLPRVFEEYAKRLNLPTILRKGEYYLLVPFIPIEQINPEIIEKLDAIVEVAQRAQPRKDEV